MQSTAQLDFIGAMLQLRGLVPVSQPLEDASGNLLVYTGEIFGGINIADDSNDLQVLLHELEISCSSDCLDFHMNGSCKSELGKSIPDILSAIKGPRAFIYWQERSKNYVVRSRCIWKTKYPCPLANVHRFEIRSIFSFSSFICQKLFGDFDVANFFIVLVRPWKSQAMEEKSPGISNPRVKVGSVRGQ
ncbi:hypothetical protein KSP39_PZI015835 [Platanthera zijinensis]|uniref:Uncharacterized protein n=1 Tax=Platanthera zijinensis TaxID=2320716 RepID=A0AAP0B8Q1_9ASPA